MLFVSSSFSFVLFFLCLIMFFLLLFVCVFLSLLVGYFLFFHLFQPIDLIGVFSL